MRNKIPPDAFDYYRDLGPARTYAAVAAHYGVSLRGVTKRAVKEDWRGRIERIEAEARRRQDEKAIEDATAIDQRHLKVTRAILSRALEALRSMPLNSAMSAVRAIDVAVKLERAVLGRNKPEAQAGPSLSELLVAAALVPAARIEELRQLGGGSPAAPPPAPAPQSPVAAANAAVLPAVPVPRVFAEN